MFHIIGQFAHSVCAFKPKFAHMCVHLSEALNLCNKPSRPCPLKSSFMIISLFYVGRNCWKLTEKPDYESAWADWKTFTRKESPILVKSSWQPGRCQVPAWQYQVLIVNWCQAMPGVNCSPTHAPFWLWLGLSSQLETLTRCWSRLYIHTKDLVDCCTNTIDDQEKYSNLMFTLFSSDQR